MALRVAVPERIRVIAIVCVVAGIALLEESSADGWPAWVAAASFSVGVALYDGLADGRLGLRQLGMVLMLMGMAGATWAILVVFLSYVFLETSVSPLLFVLLTAALVALSGGVVLRRTGARQWQWPRLVMARIRGADVAAAKQRAA